MHIKGERERKMQTNIYSRSTNRDTEVQTERQKYKQKQKKYKQALKKYKKDREHVKHIEWGSILPTCSPFK